MNQEVTKDTKQKNKALQSLRVYVTADMSQVDEAISKIKELKELIGSLEINLTVKKQKDNAESSFNIIEYYSLAHLPEGALVHPGEIVLEKHIGKLKGKTDIGTYLVETESGEEIHVFNKFGIQYVTADVMLFRNMYRRW